MVLHSRPITRGCAAWRFIYSSRGEKATKEKVTEDYQVCWHHVSMPIENRKSKLVHV